MRLDKQDHDSSALWAADGAERVLPYFEEKRSEDDRPRKAVEAGRDQVRGELKVGEGRAAAIAAHAAARASGHAAATVYVAAHAPHATNYAVKAATYAAVPADSADAIAEERDWQYRHPPKYLRPVVFPARGNS